MNTVDLTKANGTYKLNIANSATSYTVLGSPVNGGHEIRLINAASEPTVTGATKIKGSTFLVSTDMYLVSWYVGGLTQYHFQAIAP